MYLTNYGIEAMGFSEIPAETKIEATFVLIRGFQVDGLTFMNLDKDSQKSLFFQINEISFIIGNDLNDMSKFLIDDPLLDNEEEWKKK